MSATIVSNLPHKLIPLAVATKSVTISSTAGTLEGLGSFTLSADARYVQVAIKTNAVNFDPSGTAPTATVGQPVLAGQVVLMSREEAVLGKWIRQSADATADVNQYTI